MKTQNALAEIHLCVHLLLFQDIWSFEYLVIFLHSFADKSRNVSQLPTACLCLKLLIGLYNDWHAVEEVLALISVICISDAGYSGKPQSCVTGGHVGSITVQQMSHKDYVNLLSVYVACMFWWLLIRRQWSKWMGWQTFITQNSCMLLSVGQQKHF